MDNDLQTQIEAIKSAPLLYGAAVLVVGLFIWAVIDRLYSHRLEGLKERIDGLKEQLGRKSEPSSPAVDGPLTRLPSDSGNAAEPEDEERIAVPSDVTPTMLYALFEGVTQHEGSTRAKVYVGKWITITGTVKDVIYDPDEGWSVPVATEGGPKFEATMLRFESPEIPKVEMLRKGQTITAKGKIYSLNNLWLSVTHCKLLD